MQRYILMGVALSVLGCTSLRGPAVEMSELGKPEAPPSPPSAPFLAPETPNPGWRTWIPRHVTPDGTTVEGHWMELSQEGPRMEVVDPPKTFPKPPRGTFQRPKTTGATGQAAGPLIPQAGSVVPGAWGMQASPSLPSAPTLLPTAPQAPPNPYTQPGGR